MHLLLPNHLKMQPLHSSPTPADSVRQSTATVQFASWNSEIQKTFSGARQHVVIISIVPVSSNGLGASLVSAFSVDSRGAMC